MRIAKPTTFLDIEICIGWHGKHPGPVKTYQLRGAARVVFQAVCRLIERGVMWSEKTLDEYDWIREMVEEYDTEPAAFI